MLYLVRDRAQAAKLRYNLRNFLKAMNGTPASPEYVVLRLKVADLIAYLDTRVAQTPPTGPAPPHPVG